MKIGYHDFWIQFEPTIEQVINVIKYIWRELNMNIPFWLFLLFVLCIYIYAWRVKISEWKMKRGMAKVWHKLLEIRDVRTGILREKGMNQAQIDSLNFTNQYEWNQIFSWDYPPENRPSIFWFMGRRKK